MLDYVRLRAPSWRKPLPPPAPPVQGSAGVVARENWWAAFLTSTTTCASQKAARLSADYFSTLLVSCRIEALRRLAPLIDKLLSMRPA